MSIQELINKFFHTDNNTSATIIITIIVFGIGQIMIGLGKLITLEISRAQTRAQIRYGCRSLNRAVRLESNYLKRQSEVLVVGSNFYPALGGVSPGITRVFDEVSSKDAQSAFAPGFLGVYWRSKRENAINRIYSIHAGLKSLVEAAQLDHIDRVKEYKDLRQKRDGSANELISLLDSLHGKQIQVEELPFFQELTSIYEMWLSHPEKNPSTFNRYLVARMRILLKKFRDPTPFRGELNQKARAVAYDYLRMYYFLKASRSQYRRLHQGAERYRRLVRIASKTVGSKLNGK